MDKLTIDDFVIPAVLSCKEKTSSRGPVVDLWVEYEDEDTSVGVDLSVVQARRLSDWLSRWLDDSTMGGQMADLADRMIYESEERSMDTSLSVEERMIWLDLNIAARKLRLLRATNEPPVAY